MQNIYSIQPDFTFDTESKAFYKKYGIDWRYTSSFYLLDNQKWYDYCKEKYGFKIPSELRVVYPNLSKILHLLEGKVLRMPEPFAYLGIRDLILSTDMPMGSAFFTISKKIFDLIKTSNQEDNFIQIPTRVFVFDTYPSEVIREEWKSIENKLVDYIDDFISLVSIIEPFNIFKSDSLIKPDDEFFWKHKDSSNVIYDSNFNYGTLPLFFKIPTSHLLHVTEETKETLENIHVKGIKFSKI